MRRFLFVLPLLVLAACGGRSPNDAVKIEGPEFEPQRVAIQTLEPGPPPTPTPSPSPTPVPTATPLPVGPPRGASITSAAGRQTGSFAPFCWSEQVSGPSKCFRNEQVPPSSSLEVKAGEVTLLRLDVDIDPDAESIRPFQGTRSGYPSQPIDAARETDLTIDLPKGMWSMDICATWHGRGQPICWLFRLSVI